jgi:hypothetical protein
MALGNLSIKVSADIGGYTTNMDVAKKTAQSSMGDSSAAVNEFAKAFVQSQEDMTKATAAMNANMEASAKAMSSNMEAANDAIISTSGKAAESVQAISDTAAEADFSTMGEKIASAIGQGVGAGMVAAKVAWDGFAEYSKTKAMVIGIAVSAMFAAVGLGAAYTAYKLIKFSADSISAMMDGTFYKSENIDSLIAANTELKDLQENLRLSAIEAGALNETFKRMGESPGDYKAVYAGIDTAIRSNGEELDRLGVKYKGADGAVLDNRKTLENAKAVLDTYTEGWDRNQAAAAIGIGTYAQITSALKVSAAEVQKSKERMDEYQLGVTAGTQEMVTKYQTAMREFGRENDLMAQGFKRVYADAVMPLYTDMANMMKEGWPSIVQATRIGVSTVVGLFYALKDGVYIVYEPIRAVMDAIALGIIGLGTAAAKLAQGDVKGAGNALALGWEMAKDRVKQAGANIVAEVMANDAKIKLATGGDGRDASIASAKVGPIKKLKGWQGKPEDEAEDAAAAGQKDDVAKSLLEKAMKEQEAIIASEKQMLADREQFLKIDYDTDVINAKAYYGSKQKLIVDELAATQAGYAKEIAALEAFKKSREKDGDRVAAQTRIDEVKAKSAAAEIAANKAIALSYVELEKEKQDIAKSFMLDAETEAASFKKRTEALTAYIELELASTVEGNKLLEKEAKRHAEAMLRAEQSDRQKKIASDAFMLQNEKEFSSQVAGYWIAANATIMTTQQHAAKLTADAMAAAAHGVASSISQAIIYGKNLGESLKNVALSIADNFITAFIEIGIKKMLTDKIAAGAFALVVGAQSAAMVAMASLNAFASTAAIPIVGPLMAPEAAIAAGAAASVFAGAATAAAAGGVASARGGWDVPDGNDPLAQLHRREMVLPEAQADVIRGLAKNPGNGPQQYAQNDGRGGSGGDTHNWHIHAMDATGVERVLRDHGPKFAREMRRQARNFSPTHA